MRDLPRFSVDNEHTLITFQDWMQGTEGKLGTPRVAREITTDVSNS